jgi:uncharacterized SAM-binding protein YcdF (DUF218 family)
LKKFWDIILGIIIIIYILIINLISGVRIAFSFPIIFSGIILILYHFVKYKITNIEFLSRVFSIVKIFLFIIFICILGIEIAIISYPKRSENKTDYLLVLGAGLTDKNTPNLILQGRLDAAIKCLKENSNEYIVLSGGQGSNEDIPESYAMRKYLEDRGIDKKKIIIEDKSVNTNENFKFSKEKIEEHSHKSLNKVSVKIITTDFHALRSSILAKRNGYMHFDNYSSSTVWYLIPVNYTREAFALMKSILFDY